MLVKAFADPSVNSEKAIYPTGSGNVSALKTVAYETGSRCMSSRTIDTLKGLSIRHPGTQLDRRHFGNGEAFGCFAVNSDNAVSGEYAGSLCGLALVGIDRIGSQ